MSWEGLSKDEKPDLKLKGKKVIVEDVGCYDASIEPATTYRRKVTLTFDDEDRAREYYYKKR